MRNRLKAQLRLLFVLFMLSVSTTVVSAQTTAFTYQGQLSNNSTPANGSFDLQFALFNLVQNGSQQGGTVTQTNVSVVNGIFTVQLDFGSNVFTSNGAQFMEIGVRPGGTGGAFTILAPRVPITPTPYSIRTISAASADTATNATQLGGVAASQYVLTTDTRLSDARAPTAGSTNYIQNAGSPQTANFNISGNGTVGSTLSANIVNATTQYNLGGNLVLISNGATGITSVGLQTGTAGASSTMVGNQAGKLNTGTINTFVGAGAGTSNTSGSTNTFVGQGAGAQNTTASNNSFFGTQAGFANTTGNTNSFFGMTAGDQNTTGSSNAFFGMQAGFLNSTGIGNTAVGRGAGLNNSTGGNNTFVGFQAGPPNGTGDLTQSAAFGANAQVTTDNTIVLGTGTETTQIPGKLTVSGITVISTLGAAGPTSLCRNASNQISSCSSSLRYKTNLTPYNKGLDIIDHLNPIAFTWKEGGMRDLGFGAEDVAKIEPLLVTYNQQGQVEGLKYDRITAILVNAVKEQQTQISAQRQQIESLKQLVCADHPGADICK